MYILHQEGSFFYCPFFTNLFKYEGGVMPEVFRCQNNQFALNA